jgi:hypothetical protein
MDGNITSVIDKGSLDLFREESHATTGTEWAD